MSRAFSSWVRTALLLLSCTFACATHAFCIVDSFVNASSATEQYDAATDRYFLDWRSQVMMCGLGLEHAAPAGTTLTGLTWDTPATAVACTGASGDSPLCALARPMCEFVSTADSVPSVFLTINAHECEALKRPGSGWTFVPMNLPGYPGGDASMSAYDVDPATLQCAASTVPVYRFVKVGPDGLLNHRYVADEPTRAQMRTRPGWHEEGLAFCVTRAARRIIASTDLEPWYAIGGDSRIGACPNGLAFSNRFCLQSANMPALASTFTLPDSASIAAYHAETGAGGYVIATSQPAGASTAFRSFAQFLPSVLAPTGYFVTYADRTQGNISSLVVTTAFVAATDSPLRQPFAGAYDVPMDMLISYRAFVKTVRAEGDGNEAYVQPLVTFVDVGSNRRLVLSPGGIGTVASMDLAAIDAASGNALVALAPGTTTIGRSTGLPSLRTPKTFDSDHDWGWGGDFAFRINRDEFARAIALARTVDPALGTDPAKYMLESVGLKGEIVGQSSIGYNIERMWVSLIRP